MKSKLLKVAIVSVAAMLIAGPAWAQSATPAEGKSRVVAKVNGHEITVNEVELAADDIMTQLGEVPPKLRFAFLVEYLLERHLLAQAAVKEGIADSDAYKERLAFYQAKALRDAYYATKLKPTVTEEAVKQAYEEQAAKVSKEERVRARHILLGTEQEAKDIAARLAKGEKFEDLAKQYSLDGSKDYGGDLGFFTAGEMVPEFSNTAFALKVGEVSQPVKTDFGWHVIKLEDRRTGGAQPYDNVKTQIRLVLLRKSVQDKIIELRQAANIEVFDPDLKKLQQEAEKVRDKIDERMGVGQGQTSTGGKGDKVE